MSLLLVVSICLSSKSYSIEPYEKWFNGMLNTNTSTDSISWEKSQRYQTWLELRSHYNDSISLMEMSWEERDRIWQQVLPKGLKMYRELAGRYRNGYLNSCNERGVQPVTLDTSVNSLTEVKEVRKIYLASRKAEYVILTPPPPKSPLINSAKIYGVRPGHEIIYRIAATGEKPMKYQIMGLPKGCTFDPNLGVIRGNIARKGTYPFIITARNRLGKSSQRITIVVGESIALTPPMGWNSWNSFACNVTAAKIKETADLLIKTGLADYGWSFINIDDCWMKVPDITNMPEGKEKEVREAYYKAGIAFRERTKKVRFNESQMVGNTRDSNGDILSNKDFPNMNELTEYLHRYGFRAGLYISPGPLTCQRYEGSYKHEYQDAKQFARWGFDYLKYDWCGYRSIAPKPTLEQAKSPYIKMGRALKEIDRDIVFSICQYGMQDVWKWGKSVGGNSWRTTGDIRDNWKSMSRIGFKEVGLESYAGPGHWNDPDMLVVGYVGWSQTLRPTYLSPNEQYTHISLWSLLSAPLLMGCDLTRLDPFTYGLLSNPEVIAVDQDILGKQASRVINAGDIQVFTKPLSDGSVAVGIFNIGDKPISYRLQLDSINLSGKYRIRDIWRQQDIETITSSFETSVNRHGVKLLKLSRI